MRPIALTLALSTLIAAPLWAEGEGEALPPASEIEPQFFEGRYHLTGSLGGGIGGPIDDQVVMRASETGWLLEVSTCTEGGARLFGRLLPGEHPVVPNALRGQIGPMPVWCAYEAREGFPVLTCATDGQGRLDFQPAREAFETPC